MSRSNLSQKKVIAIVLIVLAVLIFLNNVFDWHFFASLNKLWPLLLILFGLVHLISTHGNKTLGTIVLVLGIIFQLIALNSLHFNFTDLFWPALLLILGVSLLRKNPVQGTSSKEGAPSGKDILDHFGIFSGSKQTFVSQDFKGGSCNVLFGGVQIDLKAVKTNQKELTINLSALFGGIDLAVPNTWKVNAKGTPILGGFTDNRKDITSDPEAPVLEIHYFVFCGGISLVDDLK